MSGRHAVLWYQDDVWRNHQHVSGFARKQTRKISTLFLNRLLNSAAKTQLLSVKKQPQPNRQATTNTILMTIPFCGRRCNTLLSLPARLTQ